MCPYYLYKNLKTLQHVSFRKINFKNILHKILQLKRHVPPSKGLFTWKPSIRVPSLFFWNTCYVFTTKCAVRNKWEITRYYFVKVTCKQFSRLPFCTTSDDLHDDSIDCSNISVCNFSYLAFNLRFSRGKSAAFQPGNTIVHARAKIK